MKNTTHYLPLATLVLIVAALLLLAEGVAAWPASPQAPSETIEHTSTTPPGRNGITAPGATLFSYQGQLLDMANNEPVHGYVGMTFSLYYIETEGVAFWTETYTATEAVSVTNGIFHVLLGSLVPIDPEDLTGDVYLELKVNSETLNPRELLASVAYAVEAGTLPAGARTQGPLTADGPLTAIGAVRGASEATESEYTEIGHDGNNGYINTTGDGSLQFRHDGSSLMSLSDAGDLLISHELAASGDDTTKIEGSLQVGNNSWTPTFADMTNGKDLAVAGKVEQAGGGGARFYKIGIGTDPLAGEGTLTTSGQASIGGALDMTGNNINNVNYVDGVSGASLRLASTNSLLGDC